MPDPNDRFPDNVPGRWYVDRSCIMCGKCPQIAPDNFRESEDGTHDYVYKQPQNAEEEAQCAEAAAECPTSSIGNDGEETAVEAQGAARIQPTP